MAVRQVKPGKQFPSGEYRNLAELPFSPEELTERYGLTFEDDADDLDDYKLAAIELPDRSHAWFIKYRGDDAGGTLVRIDADANPTRAMALLEQIIGLHAADFLRINPNVRTGPVSDLLERRR